MYDLLLAYQVSFPVIFRGFSWKKIANLYGTLIEYNYLSNCIVLSFGKICRLLLFFSFFVFSLNLSFVILYFVFSDNLLVKNKWQNLIIFTKLFFEKDGFKINYHFSLISMQRKKYLVRAEHNRKEPQRHLLEKNRTVKFAMKFWKFLRNFLRNIPENFSGISGGKIPEKFLGISWD